MVRSQDHIENLVLLEKELENTERKMHEAHADLRDLLIKSLDRFYDVTKTIYSQNLIFLSVGVYLLQNEELLVLLGHNFVTLLKIDILSFSLSFLISSFYIIKFYSRKLDIHAVDFSDRKDLEEITRESLVLNNQIMIPMVLWLVGVIIGFLVLIKLLFEMG